MLAVLMLLMALHPRPMVLDRWFGNLVQPNCAGACPMWSCVQNSSLWATGEYVPAERSDTGDWPDRMAQLLNGRDYTQEAMPGPALALLDDAVAQGRMPAVSVDRLPRYQAYPFCSAVNVVYLDPPGPAALVAIVDPNHPGQIDWMGRDYFLDVCFGGWTVVIGMGGK